MPLSRDPDARQTLIEDALQDPTTTNRTLTNLRETASEARRLVLEFPTSEAHLLVVR